jgi:transposase
VLFFVEKRCDKRCQTCPKADTELVDKESDRKENLDLGPFASVKLTAKRTRNLLT